MEQQIPQPQILGFGSLKVFLYFPIPIIYCRFVTKEPVQRTEPSDLGCGHSSVFDIDGVMLPSDVNKATQVEVGFLSGQHVWLSGDDARAFIDWFLDISGERKVQPVGLKLV